MLAINKKELSFFEKQNPLSNEINNADVFMRGIDASYYYEGYTLYKIQELED